ncbi:hypothetical protein ACJMK2_017075 [Sinanodonta woodiana]|uniref:Protein kinase domain-containing protein n=1 Tax=Sinanodonta woodiana TaxID=1069815 RepID=A0ABD3UZ23_SINWO
MARLPAKLTPDLIRSLEDIESAMELTEQFSIPDDGLMDLDDFKNRLLLHYQKITRGNIRDKIVQSMHEAAIKDRDKRRQLRSLINQMHDVLKGAGLFESDLPQDTPIKTLSRLLKEEGTSDDLAANIERRKELLEEKNANCKIIVAGETNAGKTSCLNLLLQDPILVEKIVSSTSAITTVQNKRRRFAKVIRNNGETTDIDPLDVERLKDVICHKGDGREFHDIREVEVSINSDLLDNTLILADTPGIGENEFLEKYLIDYIEQNEIHGFIYIIKTDNAGGVHEDLLLNLLSIILKQHKAQGRKGWKFDPRATLFVCNRFDAIEPSMRQTVKDHVMKQLGTIWPDLLESQVIFFSKKIAQRDIDVDPDYINSDLQALLEGLRDMYLTVLDKRIKANYKWIDNLLRRSFHHVRTTVRMLDLSERNLQIKIKSIVERLSNFDKKSDEIIRNLEADVEELSATICADLEPYMKSPQLRTRLLSTWTEDELPTGNEKNATWGTVKAKVEKAFYNKLATVLVEWDKEHNVIKRHETEMTQKVRQGLNLLENEIEIIEADIRGTTRLRDNLTDGRFMTQCDAGVDFTSYGFKLEIFTEMPRRLPFAKNYLRRYQETPVRYAQHRSKKLLQRLLQTNSKQQNGLLPFVRWLLDHLYKFLEHLKNTIPRIVSTNQTQCDGYQKHQIKERQYQRDYEQLATSFEAIRRSLQMYGKGHIFVDDFMHDEVRVQHVTDNIITFRPTFKLSDILSGTTTEREKEKSKNPHGLWTIIKAGVLSRDKTEKEITIRVYLPSSGVDNTFHEVAKLRIMSDPHLAEFLGIHQTDTPAPAFVYDGSYWSLRRYLLETMSSKNDGTYNERTKSSVSILEETASGLDYLHNKRMVHMELTQDTITVTSFGQVKLTGACLPRVPTLPIDKVNIMTGDFVYLAPEVLRGDKYTFPADVYSFGILCAEVLTPTFIAFRNEKKMPMYEFMSIDNPSEVFNWSSLSHLPKNLTDFMQKCMNCTIFNRPSAEDLSFFFKQGKKQISKSLTLDTAFPNILSSSGTYGVPSFPTKNTNQLRTLFSLDFQR